MGYAQQPPPSQPLTLLSGPSTQLITFFLEIHEYDYNKALRYMASSSAGLADTWFSIGAKTGGF